MAIVTRELGGTPLQTVSYSFDDTSRVIQSIIFQNNAPQSVTLVVELTDPATGTLVYTSRGTPIPPGASSIDLSNRRFLMISATGLHGDTGLVLPVNVYLSWS